MNHADIIRDPLLAQLAAAAETAWFPTLPPCAEAIADVPFGADHVADAAARLQRFAPYIQTAFADTAEAGGLIESPLYETPLLQQALAQRYRLALPGRLWLKADYALPVSGSIKARGGIYEVLHHAESLALQAGLLKVGDDYALLAQAAAQALFAQHEIAVGSTGNLGLSIGIMAAKLGFKASVHMSADARQWKKDTLRAAGVNVVEYAGDYGEAVAAGRALAEADPYCHFVDDEHSAQLFLGYAVAGQRLQHQFAERGIEVSADKPLFVYLPCGVGGGPGGVAFGLKLAFGDAVHCFFAEPTHSPCMLLGVYSGLHDGISVADIGLDNRTAADGLAVGRPSGLVGRAMQRLVSGYYTIADDELFRLLALLADSDGHRVEPSAAAGIAGIARLLDDGSAYAAHRRFSAAQLAGATHLIWSTGGSMVPETEMQAYINRGRRLLNR
ncbi:D-serine ammonia-lyase [Uruburuella testudinis]|uniref:Probable D-serine dehydratase n=1 Tax=Uruburuella testudinis TaxID=1282863 RepID=A0ABY4DUY8_9NEIS|nr:D-serine ammonia-lyase [Uruburuella testudinis]UOO82273.1 D-serine ammonia-lyase [Uruburuella testudinis]